MVLPDNTKIKLSKDEQYKIHINLHDNLNFFPNFPDMEFITDLSCENYERKICVANLVFLPFQNDVDSSSFSFSYAEKICFDYDRMRLIRKILESLDDSHALVLKYDNNNYYINGIVDKSNVDNLFTDYYFISISGYLNWSAKCRNFNLFDYDKGEFYDFNHSSSDLNKLINEMFNSLDPTFSEININEFKKILSLIVEQNHGTSFVIFNSNNDAEDETDRLCKAGRGFKAKNILSYNKLLECLPQFTKVDGGLIFDKKLNCYAYSCIYDGRIDESFIGLLDRGSRYNSTKLYVHSLNKNNSSTCFGVIFSDDGGVEYVIN